MRVDVTLFVVALAVVSASSTLPQAAPAGAGQPRGVMSLPARLACQITGSGRLAPSGTYGGGDVFAGSVLMDAHGVSGKWTHHTPDGRLLIGTPNTLVCSQNGHLNISIRGTARFDGVDDAPFQIAIQYMEDRSDPDFYVIVVVDADRNLLYDAVGVLASGDVRVVRFIE
jgi:hypothetical protein